MNPQHKKSVDGLGKLVLSTRMETKTAIDMAQIWRRLGGRPEVGETDMIDVHERMADGAGYLGLVHAKIVAVGAHWSDQPAGQSGWYVQWEFVRPEKWSGKELC